MACDGPDVQLSLQVWMYQGILRRVLCSPGTRGPVSGGSGSGSEGSDVFVNRKV